MKQMKGTISMYGLRNLLIKERNRLSIIEKKANEEISHLPDGKLRISKRGTSVQYYHRFTGAKSNNGVYIHEHEKDLAHKLAQRTYDESVLEIVRKRLAWLNGILEDYKDDEIEDLFKNLSVERQKLIVPVEKTWEQQVKTWEEIEYQGKGFEKNESEIFSERKERVRSKSERTIANFLFHNGISYKFEKPLNLKGYGTIYPDFTLMSKKCGKEIYWEHAGIMDDPAYADSFIKKVKLYEKNGIYVGDRLIITFETKNTILNTDEIERICRHYQLL